MKDGKQIVGCFCWGQEEGRKRDTSLWLLNTAIKIPTLPVWTEWHTKTHKNSDLPLLIPVAWQCIVHASDPIWRTSDLWVQTALKKLEISHFRIILKDWIDIKVKKEKWLVEEKAIFVLCIKGEKHLRRIFVLNRTNKIPAQIPQERSQRWPGTQTEPPANTRTASNTYLPWFT